MVQNLIENFPLSDLNFEDRTEITTQHQALWEATRLSLRCWRKFIIAVDGRDGAGKSPISRFLSWTMNMPAIETDFFIIQNSDPLDYDYLALQKLLSKRLDKNRPVILEGICMLNLLGKLNLKPDFLVYMKNEGFDGTHSLNSELDEYTNKFEPESRADFIFTWDPDNNKI